EITLESCESFPPPAFGERRRCGLARRSKVIGSEDRCTAGSAALRDSSRVLSALGQTRQTRSKPHGDLCPLCPESGQSRRQGARSALCHEWTSCYSITSSARPSRQAKSGNSVHTVAQGALEAGLEKSPKFLSSCAVGCSQKAPK